MLEPIPKEISDVVRRLASAGVVWRFAELRHPGRESTWKNFDGLTPGDCEQLTEYHVRRAGRALFRFDVTGSLHTAKTAAEHIYRARLYRAKFHDLLGTDQAERDQPFPILSQAEARVISQEQEARGDA
jgi:hypothetical protein